MRDVSAEIATTRCVIRPQQIVFGIILVLALFLASCANVHVQPLEVVPRPVHVCIKHNPKVLVSDFVQVLQDGISRNGMTSEVMDGAPAANCEVVLTYRALRDWDFRPYLTHAEIWLKRDGYQVGYAQYLHLGGFSLMKWQGTKTKMDPVIDELFSPNIDE